MAAAPVVGLAARRKLLRQRRIRTGITREILSWGAFMLVSLGIMISGVIGFISAH